MTEEEYFRATERTKDNLKRLKKFLTKKLSLTSEDCKFIYDFLEKRKIEAKEEESFGIVFAITRYCILNCIHCAVNAKLIKNQRHGFEITTNQIFSIIDKIKDYINESCFKPFLVFGGGEPTFRPDLEEILRYASSALGAENIGLSTSGTFLSTEKLLMLEKYLRAIEISLDGFNEVHNSIRDPKRITNIKNPFLKTYDSISQFVKHGSSDKLEVTSVPMKRNIKTLPSLARKLRVLGVKNYSIHRTMPIGRMLQHIEELPDIYDYFRLFIQMAKVQKEDYTFNLHIHHSLESIYSTLFIGQDIHETKLPMGSGKHSIGIDWKGFIYFDPWGLIEPFNTLRAGNLLEGSKSLKNFMDDPQSTIRFAGEAIKKNVRCKVCKMPCGGGMRFNAIAEYISRYNKKDITKSHLIAGFSEIDPACPFYELG